MATKKQLCEEIEMICRTKNIPEDYRGIFLRIVLSKESMDDISQEKNFSKEKGEEILEKFCTATGSSCSSEALQSTVRRQCDERPLVPKYKEKFINAVIGIYDLSDAGATSLKLYNNYALDPEMLFSDAAKSMMKKLQKSDHQNLKRHLETLFHEWQKNGHLEPLPVYQKKLVGGDIYSWRKKRINRSAAIDAQKAFAEDTLIKRYEDLDENHLDYTFSMVSAHG